MTSRFLTRLAGISLCLLGIPALLLSCSGPQDSKPVMKPPEEQTALINFVASEYSSETRPCSKAWCRTSC